MYKLCEFNPWCCGSEHLGGYIPLQLFGSFFDEEAVLLEQKSEMILPFFLGENFFKKKFKKKKKLKKKIQKKKKLKKN